MHTVLDVGQCGMDHGAIRRLIESAFDARVEQADDVEGALAQLQRQAVSLVLVNRVFDLDGSDGMEVIRRMKADPQLAAVPVMLVSNYADAQSAAQSAGAEPGFGKSSLTAPATRALLGNFLKPRET